MIVQCPQCDKKYRVEEGEIPASGAAVRCPKCKNTFTIYKEISPIELVPYETEVTEEVASTPVPPVVDDMPSPGLQGTESSVAPSTMEPPTVEPPPAAVETAAVETEEDDSVQDAKQLARALVKDIVLYHKDRVDEGLRKGTLVQLVGDEIRKSWSFYREQISPDMLKDTDFFKEALNEILAKGKKIFT